jgi:hypothetical protein
MGKNSNGRKKSGSKQRKPGQGYRPRTTVQKKLQSVELIAAVCQDIQVRFGDMSKKQLQEISVGGKESSFNAAEIHREMLYKARQMSQHVLRVLKDKVKEEGEYSSDQVEEKLEFAANEALAIAGGCYRLSDLSEHASPKADPTNVTKRINLHLQAKAFLEVRRMLIDEANELLRLIPRRDDD